MVKLVCLAVLAFACAVSAIQPLSFASHMNPFLPQSMRFQFPAQPRSIVTNTITQRVDNFDVQNEATYEQRYLMNGEFFQPGGPVIVVVGGVLGLSEERLQNSMALNLARELFGYVFYVEHRYFGESFPTEDLSDSNLRFLTPDQALADLAHFINHVKQSYVTPGAEDSPVILIGGHYAGNLATWFRQKYPHLALGAWASSAPLLSVVNHDLYKETAAETFRTIGGDDCYDALETSFNYLEQLVQDDQLDTLSEIFHLCPNSYLRTDRSISTFFALIAEVFSLIVQTATVQSVSGTCRILQAPAETPAHNLLNVLELLGNGTVPGSEWCLPLDYETIVELDRETALDSLAAITGIRQYTYLSCTQLGWHHTSDSPNQPFGNRFPLDFSLQSCEDVFGDVFSNVTAHAASDRINVVHGGLSPVVTNVVFTHGDLDPWRTIGVQADLSAEAPVFIIPGSAQSQDLGALSESESQELTDTKMAIKALIRYWIAHDQGVEIVPL